MEREHVEKEPGERQGEWGREDEWRIGQRNGIIEKGVKIKAKRNRVRAKGVRGVKEP